MSGEAAPEAQPEPAVNREMLAKFMAEELARARVELRGCCRSACFGNLAGALGALQSAVANPARNREVEIYSKRTNQKFSFKYADLATCLDVIRPLLGQNGLAIVQACSVRDGRAVCVTELLHTSGEFIRSELVFLGDNDIKELGGIFTYLRRYSLCPILGLAPEDDDQIESGVHEKPAPGEKPVKEKHPAADRATGREPNQARSARSAPRSEPAKPEPAKPEPAKPEPAKPEPAKPEAARPEPSKGPNPARSSEGDFAPVSDAKKNAMMNKLLGLITRVDGVMREDGTLDREATWPKVIGRLEKLNEEAPFGQICALNEEGTPSLQACSYEQIKDLKAIYEALLIEMEAP